MNRRARVLLGVVGVTATLAVLWFYFGLAVCARPPEPDISQLSPALGSAASSASAPEAERVLAADTLALAPNARSWPVKELSPARYPPADIVANRDTPDRVALDLGNEALLVDLDHERKVAAWPAQDGYPARVALAGGVALVATRDELRAFDMEGRLLWNRSDLKSSGTGLLRAASAREILAVAGALDEFVALDMNTGVTRWSAPRDFLDGEPTLVSDGESFYVGSNPSTLEARNGVSGEVRYRVNCDPEREPGRGPASCGRLGIDNGRITAVGTGIGYAAVWDVATGRLIRSLEPFATKLGFTPTTSLLTGSTWILAGMDWQGPKSVGTTWVELDVASGERQRELALEPIVEVVAGDDEILARSSFGTVYRIRDGRVIARWGFQGGHALAVVGSWIVVDEARPSRVVALHRDEMREAGPTIRVTGTARYIGLEPHRNVEVIVGERVVRAHDDGTFEAEIATRGVVRVSVKPDSRSGCDQVDDVFVDGTTPMPIAVQTTFRPCMNL